LGSILAGLPGILKEMLLMLLCHAIDLFLKLERAVNTTNSYAIALRYHLQAAFGETRRLAEITYADLVDFTYQLRQKLALNSYVRYVRVLKTFFKWAVQVGYILASPAAAIPCRKVPRDRHKSRAIPFPVLEAMLLRLERTAPRDYAITLFLAETACRCAAVAQLKIADLDIPGRRAQVLEKGNELVIVEFGDKTAQALQAWLALRPPVKHDYVFVTYWRPGRPMSPPAVTHVIRRASELAGTKAYGSHSIRHWVAEYLIQSGQSANVVKQKLNHKHLRTTEEYYLPPDDNALVHRATAIVSQCLSSISQSPGLKQAIKV
jgi:integrase